MEGKIHSSDLFESAFLLTCECHLEGVRVVDQRGRTVVTFLLKGRDIEKACEDYRFGRATANVSTLKHSLKHLKDVMFTELRKTGRKQHAY